MAERFHRRSIRLRGYDYAQAGAYYVTVCTHERGHLFGHIADGVMVPNALGGIAQRCWDAIPEHMPHVDVGEFVVMPNHVHGIVVIRERLVDVRGDATDGVVGGVMGVGARHDAPDTNATAPDANVPNVARYIADNQTNWKGDRFNTRSRYSEHGRTVPSAFHPIARVRLHPGRCVLRDGLHA